MTIEPLGSMMSAQAQPIANKPNMQTAKANDEYVPQDIAEIAQGDYTINAVNNAKDKGTAGEDSQEGRQTAGNSQSNNDKIKKAVEKLNKSMANSEAIFGIHDETNRVTIKIINRSTKEIIKELPPEKTLDMIARVWEMAGILVDEKR